MKCSLVPLYYSNLIIAKYFRWNADVGVNIVLVLQLVRHWEPDG